MEGKIFQIYLLIQIHTSKLLILENQPETSESSPKLANFTSSWINFSLFSWMRSLCWRSSLTRDHHPCGKSSVEEKKLFWVMKYCRTTGKISPSYLNCDSSSFLLNISGVNDALVTFLSIFREPDHFSLNDVGHLWYFRQPSASILHITLLFNLMRCVQTSTPRLAGAVVTARFTKEIHWQKIWAQKQSMDRISPAWLFVSFQMVRRHLNVVEW